MSKAGKLLTATEAAEESGFSRDYIRKLCANGTLKGEQFGKTWVLNKSELRKLRRQRHRRETEDADGSEK